MVSDQTITKHAKELMKLYKELYIAKNKSAPLINSYRDLWGFRNIYEDLVDHDKQRPREVIEYFFERDGFDQQLIELFRNYDKYSEIIDERRVDQANREKLRLETEQRVKEWQAKNVKHTGTAS